MIELDLFVCSDMAGNSAAWHYIAGLEVIICVGESQEENMQRVRQANILTRGIWQKTFDCNYLNHLLRGHFPTRGACVHACSRVRDKPIASATRN